MKLLIETQKSTVLDGLKLNESVDSNGNKQLYIEGIFAQAEVLNGNKRIYPRHLLESAVAEYNKDYIEKGKSIGEFNHPDYPTPNWAEAAIMIKELRMVKNDVYGRALVLDTEKGRHLKALIIGGFNVGVSTRGLGNTRLNESGTVEVTAYKMTAIDAVDDPSAPDAYVTPILESKNWIEKNGTWVEKENTDKFVNQICEALKSVKKSNAVLTKVLFKPLNRYSLRILDKNGKIIGLNDYPLFDTQEEIESEFQDYINKSSFDLNASSVIKIIKDDVSKSVRYPKIKSHAGIKTDMKTLTKTRKILYTESSAGGFITLFLRPDMNVPIDDKVRRTITLGIYDNTKEVAEAIYNLKRQFEFLDVRGYLSYRKVLEIVDR